MNNKKFIKIALAVTIISAIALAGVMVKMISENSQCVDHPFEYSAEKLEESGGMYSCGCDSYDPELLDFTFDKDGIHITEEKPVNFQDIDFSNIKVG